MRPRLNNLAILRVGYDDDDQQYVWTMADGFSDQSPLFQFSPAIMFNINKLPSLVEHATSKQVGTFGEFKNAGRILNPLPKPDQTVCTALNYPSHARELGEGKIRHPLFFSKHPKTLIDPYSPLKLADEKILLDHEVELGVVIGRDISWRSRLTPHEAEASLFGYVLVNDVTGRRFLIHDNGFLWRGKNLPESTPVGPCIIPVETMKSVTDFIEPATPRLQLTSRIERHGLCQNGSTVEMTFSVASIINTILESTSLSAGDLLMTGTPGGTGLRISPIIRFIGKITNGRLNNAFLKKQEKSPLYLRVGDTLSTSGEWLGTQVNQIVGF